MKKRGLILGALSAVSLFALNFVSAFSYQNYGNFSFQSLIQSLDPSLVISAILFVVFFAILFFSTSKIFKGNKAIASIISICLSLLIIYGLNNTIDFNSITLKFLTLNLGISNGTLYAVLPIMAIAFLIIISQIHWGKGKKKLGFGNMLVIVGVILLIITLTSWIYEKGAAAAIGLVFIIVGLIARHKKKDRIGGGNRDQRNSNRQLRRQLRLQKKQQKQQEEAARRQTEEEERRLRTRNEQIARQNAMHVARRDYDDQNRGAGRNYQWGSRHPRGRPVGPARWGRSNNLNVPPGRMAGNRRPQQPLTTQQSMNNLRNKLQMKRLREQERNAEMQQRQQQQEIRREEKQEQKAEQQQEQRLLQNQRKEQKLLQNERKGQLLLETREQQEARRAQQKQEQKVEIASERAQREAQEQTRKREKEFEKYRGEYDSRMREYNGIMQEYNKLRVSDPQNPRTRRLYQDGEKITKELNRIRTEMEKIERQ